MTSRGWMRLILIGLGASVVPLDTAVNIAFPAITQSFHLPIAMIQWVVIAYVLTYASLMLAFGRIGDIFGHARVFRIGLLWATIAFVLCSLAPSYGFLLFFRFLQGIGAGLVISCAPALVTSLYPEERRARALGAFTMMFALGSAAGPLIGGALVARWGWPGVFWFRAPIAFLSFALIGGMPVGPARTGEREPLDIVGAILLTVGTSTVLLLLDEARSLLALPLAIAAFASLFAFFRWERRSAAPIVNLALFKNPGFAALNVANVVINLASFSILLFVPYFLVRFTSLPLAVAGAVLAAAFAGMIAASPLAGRVLERLAADRVAALGAAIVAGGLVMIGEWKALLPGWTLVILLSLLLQGFGLGLFQVSYMEIVMRTLPMGDRGVAGSVTMLTRTIGIVLGATLLTLVFHGFEAGALARGASAAASFLSAFRDTLRIAAVASLGVAVIAILPITARK